MLWRDQKNRHVAHHFARWRHFDDVAESHVDVGVGARDFVPARAQPHGFGLRLQVGILAARHLVDVNFGGAGLGSFIERRVVGAHDFPVIGAFIQRIQIEPGIAIGVGQRRHNGVQVRLAGGSAHGRDGGIGGIDACFGCFQDGSGVDAAGVVRVEMDRQADFFLQAS